MRGQVQLDKFGWNDANPVAFNEATPELVATLKQTFNTEVSVNDKRLFYGLQPAVNYAMTIWSRPPGHVNNPPGVYGCAVVDGAWDWGKEELGAIIAHEVSHLKDYENVVNTEASLASKISKKVPSGFSAFTEVGAYFVAISDQNVSYKFLGDDTKPAGRSSIWFFVSYYEGWRKLLPHVPLDATTKAEMKTFLQAMYDNIPFEEMKNPDYFEHIVRP